MKRTILSSRLTPVYKYVFPVAMSVLMFGAFRERQFVALAFMILLASMVFTLAYRLKSIEVDERLIYIRGAWKTSVERLDNIVAVDEQWVLAPSWARISFRAPTAFGVSVVFISKGFPVPYFRDSEGVGELRKLAGL